MTVTALLAVTAIKVKSLQRYPSSAKAQAKSQRRTANPAHTTARPHSVAAQRRNHPLDGATSAPPLLNIAFLACPAARVGQKNAVGGGAILRLFIGSVTLRRRSVHKMQVVLSHSLSYGYTTKSDLRRGP